MDFILRVKYNKYQNNARMRSYKHAITYFHITCIINIILQTMRLGQANVSHTKFIHCNVNNAVNMETFALGNIRISDLTNCFQKFLSANIKSNTGNAKITPRKKSKFLITETQRIESTNKVTTKRQFTISRTESYIVHIESLMESKEHVISPPIPLH